MNNIDKQHPLTNEKTFEKWLGTLCCYGCKYFNEKCTHEQAEANEKDKSYFIENDERDVNSFFVCENFKSIDEI